MVTQGRRKWRVWVAMLGLWALAVAAADPVNTAGGIGG